MTTQTLTLTDFLLARIAEDAEVARRVRPDEYLSTRDDLELWAGEDGGYAHVAITSARVLAECEANRRIVERHTGAHLCPEPADDEWATWYIAGEPVVIARPCADLRDLASIYANHPDFREEWRV